MLEALDYLKNSFYHCRREFMYFLGTSLIGQILFFAGIAAGFLINPVWGWNIIYGCVMSVGFILGMVPLIARRLGQSWMNAMHACGRPFWIGYSIGLFVTWAAMYIFVCRYDQWLREDGPDAMIAGLPSWIVWLLATVCALLVIQWFVFIMWSKMRYPQTPTYQLVLPAIQGLLRFGWITVLLSLATIILGSMLLKIGFGRSLFEANFLVLPIALAYMVVAPFALFRLWFIVGDWYDQARDRYIKQ